MKFYRLCSELFPVPLDCTRSGEQVKLKFWLQIKGVDRKTDISQCSKSDLIPKTVTNHQHVQTAMVTCVMGSKTCWASHKVIPQYTDSQFSCKFVIIIQNQWSSSLLWHILSNCTWLCKFCLSTDVIISLLSLQISLLMWKKYFVKFFVFC